MSAKKAQVKQGRPSQKPTQKHSPRKIVGTILAFLASIFVPLILEWTGVVDFRFWEDEESAAGLVAGTYLVAEGPVKVKWLDKGNAIEAIWEPITDPDLYSYSVSLEGTFPVEVEPVSVGYRLDKRLRTSREVHPYSLANKYLSDQGSSSRVAEGQEWRICVTGARKVPADAGISLIERSKRCSDVFSLPKE